MRARRHLLIAICLLTPVQRAASQPYLVRPGGGEPRAIEPLFERLPPIDRPGPQPEPVAPPVGTETPPETEPQAAEAPAEHLADEIGAELGATEELLEIAAPEPPPKIWSGSFDLGLNGSEGNSRLLNIRFGTLVERKRPSEQLTVKLNYLKSRDRSMETANRLLLDSRAEWPLEGSPWSFYVHETTDYDEFRDFDFRVTADAGLGYQFIKTETTDFKGRLGPGVMRELGSTDDRWVPELVFNLALERQLSKRQKLVSSVDYFPDVTDFGDFRVNTHASWQLTLDETNNLSLKVSIVDRYDSTPGDSLPNDLDYATTVVWSF